MDTETYLQSAQTISEACSAALLDHDYTYFMDEADKTWLDNTNHQCSVEEQIARETPSADTDEIFIRVSISEDEFELVMGVVRDSDWPEGQNNASHMYCHSTHLLCGPLEREVQLQARIRVRGTYAAAAASVMFAAVNERREFLYVPGA
ncbi:hypothetical protein B0H14DRAFT_2575889 [Mycena olivaceomarginata]|nr:hypothetical protein B0H14DRAFT_2575889 [Mycena olivaceomarginata]